MDLNVTPEQIAHWQSGALIQDAMPHLTANEREFLITGITADEWNRQFGKGTVVEVRSEQP